jgi:hypothetical protein
MSHHTLIGKSIMEREAVEDMITKASHSHFDGKSDDITGNVDEMDLSDVLQWLRGAFRFTTRFFSVFRI